MFFLTVVTTTIYMIHLGKYHKCFILRRSTQHAMLPGLAGSRHVTPLAAEALVSDRLWYCTDFEVRGCTFSCTGPASCQAELPIGGVSICLCLTGVLLCPPPEGPEGHPGQLAYTLVIRILKTSHTSV
jgi:hypothetical protein